LKTSPSGTSPFYLFRLPHKMPNQIIGQQMTPEFFTNHLGAFTPKDIHLHGNFYVTKIKLNNPSLKV
ncbi:unnamed protein product, partial [marine sediment metagenome]